MKKFYLAGVLGALLCAFAISTNAAPKAAAKVPVVTRDNFVSLELFRRESKQSAGYWLRFDGSSLRVKAQPVSDGGFFNFSQINNAWSEPASLSRNQVESFLKIINSAELQKLDRYYAKGKSSVEGFVEVLALTVSDEKDRDQKIEIQNSIDSPPRGYSQVIEYLDDLKTQKFSDKSLSIPEADWVTENNFSSLTLETTGGVAGMHSLIEIMPRPMTSSIGGWRFTSSQTLGGQTTTAEGGFLLEIPKFIGLMNAANFSKLDGKSFKQENLAGGSDEILTLKLNNGKTFTVSNYGDTAPAEYSALIQYLNELKSKAIPVQ